MADGGIPSPATDDYAEHFRAASSARNYDTQVYDPSSFDAHISAMQMAWIRDLVRRRFTDPPVHLDFACGTGRALAGLRECTGDAHGYDISAEMLARAEAKGLSASLNLIEPVVPPTLPPLEGRPVVVTILRLMLNSGPETRDAAIEFARRALAEADTGLAIVDNHGNYSSLRSLARLKREIRGPWLNTLSDRATRLLFAKHGLRVTETHGTGLLPPTAYRTKRFAGIARRINEAASERDALSRWSITVTYACALGSRGAR